MSCDAVSPSGRPCRVNAAVANHRTHFDGEEFWANDAYRPRTDFRPGRSRAERVSHPTFEKMREVQTTSKVETRLEGDQQVVHWSEEGWLAHAWVTLMDFLKAREEPFTTPEHLWPLLPDPQPDVDRRILARLVHRALRDKAIEEVGAVRLSGTYHSANGSEWKQNKIVPVYRSLL